METAFRIMRAQIKSFARLFLPRSLRRWLVRVTRRPGVGRVDFGDFRRLKPISQAWGGDRGLPLDRYYIERFLEEQAGGIR